MNNADVHDTEKDNIIFISLNTQHIKKRLKKLNFMTHTQTHIISCSNIRDIVHCFRNLMKLFQTDVKYRYGSK